MSIKSLSVRGIDISYLIRNPGDTLAHRSPTTVLLHETNVNKYDWFSLIWFLPRSWQIVALNLPGHCDSGYKETERYLPYEVAGMLHEAQGK